MPCEKLAVHFKPVNFFEKNPALDVPPSIQTFNKSVLLSEDHKQGAEEVKISTNGVVEDCCDAKSSSKL